MTAFMNERFLSPQERLIADLRHQNAQLMERNAELRRMVSWYEALFSRKSLAEWLD